MGLISNTVFISIYIHTYRLYIHVYIVGLVQERRNSIANALELRLLTHRYTTPAFPFVYLINILNHIHLSSMPPIHLCMNSQLPSPIHPSYFLSFHISTLSSSLLSFWDPAIQPCVHPSINYPLGITPTLHPLITPTLPPSYPSILSLSFLFFGSINALKL